MSQSGKELLILHHISSPRDARVAAERVLVDQCPPGQRADIIAVISELVSNALRHTSSGCTLIIDRLDTGYIVEVHDTDTPAAPRAANGDDAPLGRGLGVVQTLAQRWGIERLPHGKAVWAQFNTG